VQRSDARSFSIANDLDPAYGEAFRAARKEGVEMLCYRCRLSPNGISVEARIEIAEV
jgi:sugar fermentation stimulation protein A